MVDLLSTVSVAFATTPEGLILLKNLDTLFSAVDPSNDPLCSLHTDIVLVIAGLRELYGALDFQVDERVLSRAGVKVAVEIVERCEHTFGALNDWAWDAKMRAVRRVGTDISSREVAELLTDGRIKAKKKGLTDLRDKLRLLLGGWEYARGNRDG